MLKARDHNGALGFASSANLRRVVVTGGAGFIGSTVVDTLIACGSDVLVLDDLSRGDLANLDGACRNGAEFCELDIRDGAAVGAALLAFRPDTVFHLAAQIDVRHSMTDPAADAAVNVVGSINVFAAAAAAGVRRVVNTSTGGALYGDAQLLPTPETAPTTPASAYGLSKLTVEQYARWFREAKGLDVRTLRYGNVYGPRQDPAGDAGVIARFCYLALHGVRPTIYGDGRQTRDFVFVHDVATANLAIAAAVDLPQTAYNIGTGVEVDLLELAEAVAAAANLAPHVFRPRFEPERVGEVRRSCLDVSAARRDLALPAPTPLVDGLEHTLRWMRAVEAGASRTAS
ncbi:NAD-dependent epimerase/dehydratase family protein [Pseudonocardia charpentierae]|uniref:NAD-dependent epimerase/dehydratase family protein n=1 Tax=Pseudonocardia charpentierae TaxID=3075545 RepID=A0ABU2NHS3_9PSEU|nr:NAD-dependent epimerase/dehydratase family protein [Pseudonocardia sp. DSM 45834]MDT0353516.1 NAD-dependent epimerase/dehydratase family protein [Pseudonocardia sp. DSM 45834]